MIIKKNTTIKPKFEERKPKPFQVIKKITMTKPKFEQIKQKPSYKKKNAMTDQAKI